MLEIAKKLKEIRGGNVEFQLFFIDSAPETMKQAIFQLGDGDDYELNILRAIFNIDDIIVSISIIIQFTMPIFQLIIKENTIFNII